MDTTQFIALCDGIPAEMRTESIRRSAYQEECVRIKDALTSLQGDECAPYSEFNKLRKSFVYLKIIDEAKDYSSYFYILEKIGEHFNGSTRNLAAWSSQAWKDVIAYIKSLPEYPRSNAFTNEFLWNHEKQVAYAAVRLRQYGALVSIEDCELRVGNTEGCYARIDELMTDIGGECALRKMQSGFKFEKKIGRFLVPHQGNTPAPTMMEPETPYGYIFNLCMKYIGEKGTGKPSDEEWNELKNLCTDVALAIYDVQMFDIWEDVIIRNDELVSTMKKMVLRFDLYTLPQSNVSFVLNWCRFLSKCIKRDSRCDSTLKDKLKRAERLMEWVANISLNNRCKHIKKGSKESRLLETIKPVIGTQVIKEAAAINTYFIHPDDIDKVNGIMFPIVETDEDYILLPKPLGIWSWYEAFYNILKANRDLRNSIGYAMEDFIRNKMATNGLVSHTGKYAYDGVDGEVDFLIEGTHCDAIVESKKRSLSRNALKGDDYYIWGDLYDFLYSQMQCARLENGVKNHGPVTIVDKNGTDYRYEWKAKCQVTSVNDKMEERTRVVVKTTMTLKEYGPMQDKVVLERIVGNLIGKKINASFDPADTVHNARDQREILKVFYDINKTLNDMSNYYQAIGDKHPTFFCRFYSMEQVYFLIKEAKGDQDRFVKLLKGQNVTTGTENFWNEYLYTMQFSN